MNLATGYAFSFSDLFMKFKTRSLKVTSNKLETVLGDRHKRAVCVKVMRESVKLILEDMLENNITFELPSGSKKADIHMRLIQGEEFKNAKRNGAFKFIDFLKSYFTAYLPCLFIYSNNRTRVKPIYTSKEYLKRLADKINNGMKYC